jgi:hypothetical protein
MHQEVSSATAISEESRSELIERKATISFFIRALAFKKLWRLIFTLASVRIVVPFD